ncbi:glycosyltransferase family 4 protein [Thauera sp.]|uniref:glycosyltransferase family 4 protein n=1 Tax=Thauera sp. TaxID=1905334 RepID=UPI002D1FBD4C|nr:glycosyltransferase family 4 protein [Thauera sp.]
MSHKPAKPVICFITGSAGDWGGASRVLYTNLRQLDRSRIEPILLLPRDGPIVPELQRLGLRYHIWGSPTEPGNRLAFLRALLRTVLLFRREKVRLVHFNNRPWRPAEALAARLLGIPILLHFHVVNEAVSPVIRWASGVVVVSEFVAQASLPPELPKHVVHNPVDLHRFDQGRPLREALGIARDKLVVSFVGQIRDIKGVQDFIAMARLIDDPALVFLIAGECRDPRTFAGAYSEDDLSTMIGGDARIRYIGYIDRVEDVYASSDIVVVPSRWQEPLGLIAIEAGACGKPVIATHVGGLPEIIEDGRTGYLVDAQSPATLAERVKFLIANPAQHAQMGAAARERIVRQFAAKPVAAFEEVLVRHAKPDAAR